MSESPFKLTHRDPSTQARAGVLATAHGEIRTPVFMPVGTHAAVKTVSAPEMETLGAQVLLSNAYHLYLRPGTETIRQAGGLHRFMNWKKPILTDSGGFQIFSLKEVKKVTAEGVKFKSHIDGKTHFLTPEDVIRIESHLGSDIWMPLDQCIEYPASHEDSLAALRVTEDWAARSKKAWLETPDCKSLLFGIVQGGTHPDLRKQSLEGLLKIDFPGYAVGGLSVGEGQKLMIQTLDALMPLMPENKARYLMGVGYPIDLILAVERGVDMFDCVVPTRNGRNGTVFYSGGKLLLGNKAFEHDNRPIDENCACPACRNHSRAYIRHLFKSKEMLAGRLASLHNLHFFIELLDKMREAITVGAFPQFKKDFMTKFEKGAF